MFLKESKVIVLLGLYQSSVNIPGAFLMAQWVKNLPAMQDTQEMRVQSLGKEGPLE